MIYEVLIEEFNLKKINIEIKEIKWHLGNMIEDKYDKLSLHMSNFSRFWNELMKIFIQILYIYF